MNRLTAYYAVLVTAAFLLLGATAANPDDICKICECDAANGTIDCQGRVSVVKKMLWIFFVNSQLTELIYRA